MRRQLRWPRHVANLTGAAFGFFSGSVATYVYLQTRQSIPSKREELAHEALRYGLPSEGIIQARQGYVVSYDYRTRNASWVLEYITKDSLQQTNDTDRSKSSFSVDFSVPERFRIHPSQFLKSGFDKGHLVPARDMPISQTAMDESFLMSNISPQVGKGFNRGYWSRFEGFIRHLAHQFDGLYVVTGPLFLAKRKKTGEYSVTYPVIGTPPDAISVPTHFFKVLLARTQNKQFAVAGFILPNKSIPENTKLLNFQTPIEVIEKYSGLIFFEQLQHVEKFDICELSKCSLAGTLKQVIHQKKK